MTPQFRYQHTGGEHTPVDVRRCKTSPLLPIDCCFLGFRLKDVGGDHYHHSWILADDHGAFMFGVYLERDRILERFPTLLDTDIALVHSQSLKFMHSGFSDASRAMLTKKVQEVIGTRNDSRFACLGFEPTADSTILSDCIAADAKAALQGEREEWTQALGKPARMLAILQAHPVVKEFDLLFEMQAGVIQSLVARDKGEIAH